MFRSIVFLAVLATIATTSAHSELATARPLSKYRAPEPCEASGNRLNEVDDEQLTNELIRELVRQRALASEAQRKYLKVLSKKESIVNAANGEDIERSDVSPPPKRDREVENENRLSTSTKNRSTISSRLGEVAKVASVLPRNRLLPKEARSRLTTAAPRRRPINDERRKNDIARIIARYELKTRYPSSKDVDVGASRSRVIGKTVLTTERDDEDDEDEDEDEDDDGDNGDDGEDGDDGDASDNDDVSTTVKPRSIDSVKNKNVNKNANANKLTLAGARKPRPRPLIPNFPPTSKIIPNPIVRPPSRDNDERPVRDSEADGAREKSRKVVVSPEDQNDKKTSAMKINVLKFKEATVEKNSTARRPIVILTTAAPKMIIADVKPTAESGGKRPTEKRPNKSQRGQRRRKRRRRPSQTNKEQERSQVRPEKSVPSPSTLIDESTLKNPSGSRDGMRDRKGNRIEDAKTSDASVSEDKNDNANGKRRVELSKDSSSDSAKNKKPKDKDDEEVGPLPKDEKPRRARPTVGPSKLRHSLDNIRVVDLEDYVNVDKSKNVNVDKNKNRNVNKNLNQLRSSRRSSEPSSDDENEAETPRPRSRNRKRNRNSNVNRNKNVIKIDAGRRASHNRNTNKNVNRNVNKSKLDGYETRKVDRVDKQVDDQRINEVVPSRRHLNNNVNRNVNRNVNKNANINRDVNRLSGSRRREDSEDDVKLSPKVVESILREVKQLRRQLALKEGDTRGS